MMHDDIVRLRAELIKEKSADDIIVCCIEEMSEVTKVLTKYLRGSSKFNLNDLTEEVAHAQLMLNVVKCTFNLNDEDIASEQLQALEKALGK